MKSSTKRKFKVAAIAVSSLSAFILVVVGAPMAAGKGPKTTPVSVTELLQHKGIYYHGGNAVEGARIAQVDVSKTHLLVLGTGHVTSSGATQFALLLGVKSRDGSIHIMPFKLDSSVTIKVKPGPARITYRMDHPYKELFDRLLGKPITDTKDDYDGWRSKSAEDLLAKFVSGVTVTVDQNTYDRLFS